MIGDFVWFGLRKKIRVFSWWFFFSYYGLVVVLVVVAVVMAVVDGRGGCGWCYECFLGSEIYYFIVGDILFYCDIYIILLH